MQRVLMLSTDQKILEEGSAVRARMLEYAEAFGQLSILLITKRQFRISNSEFRINDKLTIYKTSFWRALITNCARLNLERYKYEMVTAQDPFEIGFVGWRLAKKLGAKLELQIHTDPFSLYFTKYSLLNRIRLQIAKFLLPKADSIRVVSNRIKDSLSALGFAAPITVRPVAVDTEFFRQAPVTVNLRQKYPQFERIILMASRLTKEKNIKLAIDAMSDVVKTNPKIGLIIVGSGPMQKELGARSLELGVEKNVIFEEWADKPTLASYYKTADIFLNTSLYEGYGMTLLEAKTCGLPIISTDVGIAREVGANIVGWEAHEVAQIIEK